jgi:hypothetical protein
MSTQANAKASDRNVHPGQHDRVDHDDGNDDRGPLGGWGHNVHRGIDLFDHRHGWQEPEGGHHHHHGPENAPAPADGLIAVIGGSAVAAGESSAATGFIENFAEHEDGYSIAMGEAIFQASAHSSEPGGALAAASTFLDVSGADFIFEREIDHATQRFHDAAARSQLDYIAIDIEGWAPRHGPIVIDTPQPFDQHHLPRPDALPGNFAQISAVAEAHGAGTLAATLTHALDVENHFSLVNGMAMVAL